MKLLSERFPNGITKDQKDKLQGEILERGGGCFGYKHWSEENKILDAEMSAVEMIESLFTYHHNVYDYFFVNCHSAGHSSYLDEAPGYIESYIEDITRGSHMAIEDARVELTKVFENQMKLLSKAKVRDNVYEDSDGCTYNSLEY